MDDESGLHVHFEGKTGNTSWQVREFQPEDTPFYQGLFSDSNLMKMYGNGKPKPRSLIAAAAERWEIKLKSKQPHVPMTVLSDGKLIGAVMVNNVRGKPGSGLIGGIICPDFSGKGLGFSVLKEVMTMWAPEVRRIGLGNGLDREQNADVIKSFCCFERAALEKFEASASPSNIASWRIQEKMGLFQAARIESDNIQPVVNLQKRNCALPDVEKELMKLFNNDCQAPLIPGQMYLMIDPEGTHRTFGMDPSYKKIRYYFEYYVSNITIKSKL